MQDYVKFARAKGISETRILLVHVLKNIMIPIITVLGLELGSMIAFAVVTETVFNERTGFVEALKDRIRDELAALGYVVRDTADGAELVGAEVDYKEDLVHAPFILKRRR